MSLINVSLKYNLAGTAVAFVDNLVGAANNVQAGATPLTSEVNRVTKSTASLNSFILKSILSGDASVMTYVINDSANTVNVFPAVGENQNGVANAGLAVAAGASGVFCMVTNALGGPDWRSAAIT